jgi:hypothetical protein
MLATSPKEKDYDRLPGMKQVSRSWPWPCSPPWKFFRIRYLSGKWAWPSSLPNPLERKQLHNVPSFKLSWGSRHKRPHQPGQACVSVPRHAFGKTEPPIALARPHTHIYTLGSSFQEGLLSRWRKSRRLKEGTDSWQAQEKGATRLP